MTRARWVALLAWLAGLALMAVLVSRVGVEGIWRTLSGVRFGVLAVLATGFLGIAASALPWRLLLPPALRPTVAAAVVSRTAAAGLNIILPFLSVGDASRLLWIERRGWPHGLASLVVERLLFALTSAVAVAVGAASAALLPQLPARLVPVAVGAAIAIGLLPLVGLWLAARGAPLRALMRSALRLRAAVARFSATRVAGAGPPAPPAPEVPEVQLDEALRAIVSGPRSRLALAFGQHMVARIFFTLEIYVALRALGVSLDLPSVLCLAAVPVALSIAAVIIPSQIGIQEGTQAALTAALGLGPELGLAMTLLLRVRHLLTVPLGALCFALPRKVGRGAQAGEPPASIPSA
jgi:hypothetical protein